MSRHGAADTPNWEELSEKATEAPPAPRLPVEEQDIEGLEAALRVLHAADAAPEDTERRERWARLLAGVGYSEDYLVTVATTWVTGRLDTGRTGRA